LPGQAGQQWVDDALDPIDGKSVNSSPPTQVATAEDEERPTTILEAANPTSSVISSTVRLTARVALTPAFHRVRQLRSRWSPSVLIRCDVLRTHTRSAHLQRTLGTSAAPPKQLSTIIGQIQSSRIAQQPRCREILTPASIERQARDVQKETAAGGVQHRDGIASMITRSMAIVATIGCAPHVLRICGCEKS